METTPFFPMTAHSTKIYLDDEFLPGVQSIKIKTKVSKETKIELIIGSGIWLDPQAIILMCTGCSLKIVYSYESSEGAIETCEHSYDNFRVEKINQLTSIDSPPKFVRLKGTSRNPVMKSQTK